MDGGHVIQKGHTFIGQQEPQEDQHEDFKFLQQFLQMQGMPSYQVP
jgi:hypothetical protein